MAISPRSRRAYAWLPRSWCARACASAPSARTCASSRRPASAALPPETDYRAPESLPWPWLSAHGSRAAVRRQRRVQTACMSSPRLAPSRGTRQTLEIRLLQEAHRPFKQREGTEQLTLAESEQTKPPRGHYEAPGGTVRLGDPVPFFAEGDPFGEAPQLGMARGERGTGEHSGELRGDRSARGAAAGRASGRGGRPAGRPGATAAPGPSPGGRHQASAPAPSPWPAWCGCRRGPQHEHSA